MDLENCWLHHSLPADGRANCFLQRTWLKMLTGQHELVHNAGEQKFISSASYRKLRITNIPPHVAHKVEQWQPTVESFFISGEVTISYPFNDGTTTRETRRTRDIPSHYSNHSGNYDLMTHLWHRSPVLYCQTTGALVFQGVYLLNFRMKVAQAVIQFF